MREFTLRPKQEKTIEFKIDDASFQIPLQGSLSRKEVMSLMTPEGTYSFIKKHVPKDILDNMTMEQYNEMVTTWKNVSEEEFGKPVGES